MKNQAPTNFDRMKDYLTKSKIAFEPEPPDDDSLMIPLDESECVMELHADGKLLCQFGIDLQELRNMISGGTTEDLSEDELHRSAREHLRPIVNRYKGKLIAVGFEEAVDVNQEYYAITFRKGMDFERPNQVIETLKWCQRELATGG